MSEWYLAMRELPDGRTLYILPLLFGQARLAITHDATEWDQAFDDVW